jgi:hypothetical protein
MHSYQPYLGHAVRCCPGVQATCTALLSTMSIYGHLWYLFVAMSKNVVCWWALNPMHYHIYARLIVLPWSSPEPRFKPEPPLNWTQVQSKVHNVCWTKPLVQLVVLDLKEISEPIQISPNLSEPNPNMDFHLTKLCKFYSDAHLCEHCPTCLPLCSCKALICTHCPSVNIVLAMPNASKYSPSHISPAMSGWSDLAVSSSSFTHQVLSLMTTSKI